MFHLVLPAYAAISGLIKASAGIAALLTLYIIITVWTRTLHLPQMQIKHFSASSDTVLKLCIQAETKPPQASPAGFQLYHSN